MSMLNAVLVAAALLFAAKSIAWLIQRRQGNGGIVDAIWAWALGGLAVWFAFTGSAALEVRFGAVPPAEQVPRHRRPQLVVCCGVSRAYRRLTFATGAGLGGL